MFLTSTDKATPSLWYQQAMERLVGVVQELSQARDLETVSAIVRKAARELTGADGATFVLRDGDQCHYADEDAIEPLWKGKRFPMSACISGWVMTEGRHTVIEDIYQDARIPAYAYRPTFVKSLAMVPIRSKAPIGAIGNYWATHRRPGDEVVAILQALADTTSVALENVELYGKLQAQIDTLKIQRDRIETQNEALQVFTHALSHDLKEPVRTLTAFTRLIRQEPESPENDTYLELVSEAADRMSMLVDSVFRYTTLDDPGRMTREPCGLQFAFNAAKANLARLIDESGATVESDLSDATVEANPAQVIQVLQNLMANAIRHNDRAVHICVTAEDDGANWLVSVTDDGTGIDPAYQEKIFLPFRRLVHNDDCAGLGLSTCQKIVTVYGGTIWCESTFGEGARFRFRMPKARTYDLPVKDEREVTRGRLTLLG